MHATDVELKYFSLSLTLSLMSPSKPYLIPVTPYPLVRARRTNALIAAFIPHAGAPTFIKPML